VPDVAANQGAPGSAADQGVPNVAADQGAPEAPREATKAVAQGAPYNLCPGNAAQDAFKQAIDAPHDSKSFFPKRQLYQRGLTLAQQGFTVPTPHNFDKSIFGYIMNQMTAKAGIRKHGRAALMNKSAQVEALDV
jgi:hypothetical protein